MALSLQKDLPVTLRPLTSNDEGARFQGQLKEIAAEGILMFVPEFPPLAAGAPVEAEFRIDKSSYRFESTLKTLSSGNVTLHKPKQIHKTRLREGRRIETDMKLFYTPWTESGRFETQMLDLSDVGVRMLGRRELKKGMLVSLDFYVKEDKIRVLCQGQVAWCRQDPDNEFSFETGVEFTTISNETRKRIARFIEKSGGSK
jgi:c-di-GMP-binding flagellar brake protein YcgR